jgi:hypothetical protein
MQQFMLQPADTDLGDLCTISSSVFNLCCRTKCMLCLVHEIRAAITMQCAGSTGPALSSRHAFAVAMNHLRQMHQQMNSVTLSGRLPNRLNSSGNLSTRSAPGEDT